MSQDCVVTVAEGTLKWSYYTAAALRSCTVTRTAGSWALVGEVVDADTDRLSRQPLVFVVRHQHGLWSWPIVNEPQIAEGRLRASLGPPKSDG